MNLKEKFCDDSHYKQNIPDQNLTLFVPNVITPNGDQYNDAFIYFATYKVGIPAIHSGLPFRPGS
jgi:hypothetical protein